MERYRLNFALDRKRIDRLKLLKQRATVDIQYSQAYGIS